MHRIFLKTGQRTAKPQEAEYPSEDPDTAKSPVSGNDDINVPAIRNIQISKDPGGLPVTLLCTVLANQPLVQSIAFHLKKAPHF